MSEPKSFTRTCIWTGETETRYCHECLRCRKEYTSTFPRGNSGWCSYRCQTLAMSDVYKEDVLKAGETMTRKHFEAIAEVLRDTYHRGSPAKTTTEQVYDEYVGEVRRIDWERLVASLANVCAETNPRFNREKFISACYPVYPTGVTPVEKDGDY